MDRESLQRMAMPLAARGPEGTRIWQSGEVGLGHTLLATTPELITEAQPWRHPESGCAITADVRLDNRAELLARLGLARRDGTIGDAELIVHAWLAWGEAFLERLLGDFAFALFDPRQRLLMLARDHTGMRPLYYSHYTGGPLVFASEARSVLASGLVPKRLNEGRIADFLVGQLEGYDKVSSFYEGIQRLAPAHRMRVGCTRATVERYWRPAPQPELKLADDRAYADAFLEVFTEAVRCRLRSPDPVGAMLSGGMDSGAVVAVARRLLSESGQLPLTTFSAVGPDPAACIETRTIGIAAAMGSIDPQFIDYTRLGPLMPELESTGWNLQEPFDNHMTLLRAVWISAHRRNIKVVLHGAAGDVVFAHGSYPARLMRAGHWLRGVREVWGEARFHAEHRPDYLSVSRALLAGLVPDQMRSCQRAWRTWLRQSRSVSLLKDSLISPEFARRIDLEGRLRHLESHALGVLSEPYPVECASYVDHPYAVVGHERYDRVASDLAIESRDPFMDRRVIDFCLGLPGEQRLAGGWPKVLLRRAMAGRLPDEVRWRRGKQHLGFAFTRAFVQAMQVTLERRLQEHGAEHSAYVDAVKLRQCMQATDARQATSFGWQFDAAHLANWLVLRGRPSE